MAQLYTLDNGLRVVWEQSHAHTVYAGILVGAGTRHERDDESGMAHLVEHMSFKGTRRRTAAQVINRIEAVGGELNAYTGKEETVYYAACLPEHLNRSIDLLQDIVFNSTYPEAELAREVEVVCDEIESYEDSPSELIYDDFEAHLFPGHPLGRSILGHAERLRQYTRADLQAFAARHYRPENAILFVLGGDNSHFPPSGTSPSLLGRGGVGLPPSGTSPLPTGEGRGGASYVLHRDTHQAHVMIGGKAFALNDPRHIALTLINNILGGPGMNSRLNMSLRERRGLVYTVDSSIAAYADTGVWTTYLGCDHEDVRRCIRLAGKELQRLTAAPLTERQLGAAKRQLCGQLTIAHDNLESRAISMAKRLYLTGHVPTLGELCDSINALTPDDIMNTARTVLAKENLSTLIYD